MAGPGRQSPTTVLGLLSVRKQAAITNVAAHDFNGGSHKTRKMFLHQVYRNVSRSRLESMSWMTRKHVVDDSEACRG